MAVVAIVTLLPSGSADARSEVDVVQSLINEIVQDTERTRHYTSISELSAPVLQAMQQVHRDQFVPPEAVDYAYLNRPLSIGYGQTISQPFIVALMTELLAPGPEQTVLEIGTGSGYQAAILATLVDQVYSIEIVPELAASASARLERLGYDNVHVRASDGWHGWPEAGPFDGIIVTAVAEKIPPRLVEQLKPGGRLVIPLGPAYGSQQLVLVKKTADGIEQRDVLPVQFVPFTRAEDR